MSPPARRGGSRELEPWKVRLYDAHPTLPAANGAPGVALAA
ncbi:hypothetical protein [Streptomyces sp. PTD5-9]